MNLETGMMIAFIVALIFSLWKVYAFLPNKPLEDDDRTEEIDALLNSIMITTIVEHCDQCEDVTVNELFEKMKNHHEFDQDRLWRFNPNRLNQLLIQHTIHYPEQDSIVKIYQHHKI